MNVFRHNFTQERFESLLTAKIVSQLCELHAYRAKLNALMPRREDALLDRTYEELIKQAKIQTISASNLIEGISTSEKRLPQLALNKTNPNSRSEKEIAGYRDALDLIYKESSHLRIDLRTICELHSKLYSYEPETHAGKLKAENNFIGNFTPVSAEDCEDYLDELCLHYHGEVLQKEYTHHRLLSIPLFILDFLCIHPFKDGNGRISRLLSQLLLQKEEYYIGQFLSIDQLTYELRPDYYNALASSSIGWHEEKHNDSPFVEFFLHILLIAYKRLEEKVRQFKQNQQSKPQQIESVLKQQLGKIDKKTLCQLCPGISESTIQKTLAELLKEGKISKIGGGRYSAYVWTART